MIIWPYIYIYTHVYTYMHIYIYIYTRVYVYMHIYIYIHIYNRERDRLGARRRLWRRRGCGWEQHLRAPRAHTHKQMPQSSAESLIEHWLWQ